MKIAIEKNGLMIKHASNEIKDDREMALIALKSKESAEAFIYLSHRLRNDKNFHFEAIKLNPYVYGFLHKEHQLNRDLFLEAVKGDNKIFEDFKTEKFSDDKEIVMIAVAKNGGFLKHVSIRWKNNKEVVYNGKSILYASKELQKDREIFTIALERNFEILYELKEFVNDKEIILKAVQKNSQAYILASEELKKDRDLILATLQSNRLEDQSVSFSFDLYIVFRFFSFELRCDPEIVLYATKFNKFALLYASPDLQNDKEFISKVVKGNPYTFELLNDQFQQDRDIYLCSRALNLTTKKISQYNDIKIEFK